MNILKIAAIFISLNLFTGLAVNGVQAQSACSDAPPSRLAKGQAAQVADGISNHIRTKPSVNGRVIGTLPEHFVFMASDEPVCADGFVWWKIYTIEKRLEVIGWMAEGQNGNYWLTPLVSDRWNCVANNAWENIPLAFFALADKADKDGYYDAAVLFANCLIQTDTESDALYIGYSYRGNIYLHAKEYDAALADFTHILEIDSVDKYVRGNALINRSKAYLGLGEYQLALNDVNDVLAGTNENTLRYNAKLARGQIYLASGNYKNAEVAFQTALEILKPISQSSYSPLEALLGLGDAYAMQKKYPQAIEAYHRASYGLSHIYNQTAKDYIPMNFRLGKSYDALGLLPQALGAYDLYLQGTAETDAVADEAIIARVKALRSQGIKPFYSLFADKGEFYKTVNDTTTATRFAVPTNNHLYCELQWSPDGTTLAANNYLITDGISKQYDAEIPLDVAFTIIGNQLIAAYPDTIKVWDVKTGHLVETWAGRYFITLSSDGSFAAYVGEADVVIRDLRTKAAVRHISIVDGISGIEFSPDSQLLAIGSGSWDNPNVRLINVSNGEQTGQINIFDHIFNFAFSPDGHYLSVGGRDVIGLWDVKTLTLLGLFRIPMGLTEYGDVAFSADSRFLAASQGPGFMIFDTQTGSPAAYVQEEQHPTDKSPMCLVFHPHDDRIAAIIGYRDQAHAYIWHRADLK